MSIDIYKEVILDHYKSPRNFGTFETSTNKANVANPLCGDSITIELRIEGDSIEDIRFNGEGCAIAIASASLLTEYAKNKKLSDLTI